MKKLHIIVIGGGVSGTAAAYTLTQKGYRVTVLEKNGRLGGRILSIMSKDAVFEMGAGFLTDSYTNTFNFLRSSGLDKYLQIRKSKSAIIKNNALYPLLSTPVLLGNALLSPQAKLRLIQEIAKTIANWDKIDLKNWWHAYPIDKQSIASAFRDKVGQEVLNYAIQPALDGYFYWSAEKISEAMLLLILKAGLTRHRTYMLKCGLQRIPETAAKDSDVLLSHEVTQIQKTGEGEYEVAIKSKQGIKKLTANGIVCATIATAIPKIIKGLNHKQISFFSSIHYSSTAIVAKTYNPSFPPKNYSIAYPRIENKAIGAVTIVSDIAKDGSDKVTLLKLFASGARGKRLCAESDENIDKFLTKAASINDKIFDYPVHPTFRYIQRWDEALPEFKVGHFEQLRKFMEGEFESENIVFAGDYIGGCFIDGAFTSGVQAANRIDDRLKIS